MNCIICKNILEKFSENSNLQMPTFFCNDCNYYVTGESESDVKEKLNNSKQTVVFVPIICDPWPLRPVERHQGFAMEYVKWHKALIGYFSTRKDYNFIWKGYLCPYQEFDLMSEIITQRNYNNIQFRSDKLTRYIKNADKIVVLKDGYIIKIT